MSKRLKPTIKNECGSPQDDCMKCDALKGCMKMCHPYFVEKLGRMKAWVDARGGEAEVRAVMIYTTKQDFPMYPVSLICHHVGLSETYYNKMKMLHKDKWQAWFNEFNGGDNKQSPQQQPPCYLTTSQVFPKFSTNEEEKMIIMGD